jgi:hypothetical protein
MKTGPRMRVRPGPPRAASLLFVAALACAAAADALRIESVWAADSLTIDGMLKEWASLVSLDPVKLSVAVRNDARSIYVAIAASDQPTRMLLGSAGFSVWFDPAGKHKKAFGITVPPTIAGAPGMRGRGPGGGQSSTLPEQGPEGSGPGDSGRGALEPIRHIELTAGPGKDDRRRLELAYARTIGIDVAARLAEGVLVYEIRLPLSASGDRPYFLRSTPGAAVGLGIETTKVERGREDEGRRGGGPGGGGPGGGGGIGGPGGGGGIGGIGGGAGGRGGGGMGGGMMGGGRGGGGRGGMEGQKPINVWTVVQLARSPE